MTSGDTPASLPEIAPALERTAAQYDAIPYQSKPFPSTHPARLAAIGKLFDLTPPPLRTARILEIGCAAGGNIIPLAAHLPDATCLGIDLSGVQIEQGQRRAESMGLGNVTLRQQSVTEIGPDDGPFDYIICHGVYSWVPATVREAILRVCGERLSDNGMAIVSYNVMPGWHMKLVVRDSMIAHAAHIPDPSQKAAQARWFIDLLKDRVSKETPYGNALRTELEHIADLRDDYVMHEFLEDENNPCTVTEFVRAAERARLSYLGDTQLHTMIADGYGEATAAALQQLSRNRLLAHEQYIDIITGRTFRQSILVKAATMGPVQRPLNPRRLMDLHVAAQLTMTPGPEGSGKRTYRDRTARTLTTDSATVHAALDALMARYPGTVTPAELIEAAAPAEAARHDTAVFDALGEMMNAGMLDFYIEPLRVGSADTRRPTAIALARFDAAHGASLTANLRHEEVSLDISGQLLVPLLDGTRDREALCTDLLQAMAGRDMQLKQDDAPITEPDAQRDAALQLIDFLLTSLAAGALLQADSA
ncbi:methyltransferase regulatory domain-containing protein [Reyranella sp. CPCC 100927]|uniref:methyltransferase regulatory domain-containing protein n=1 Tax=Reyranella sp. CPCC 100927 TaxID=2599616 RepID=UPI0011B584C2|nr:class I SAM-dependent methyltransferase [Reyranella sp. CPCC 100927]TWS98290.1 methyltransferase domain-containing protein [Reyranella sp. CPCC 100927]